MTPEEVDAAIETFPVTATAAMLGVSEKQVHDVLRVSIAKASANGGSIENMRKVIDAALRKYSHPR